MVLNYASKNKKENYFCLKKLNKIKIKNNFIFKRNHKNYIFFFLSN